MCTKTIYISNKEGLSFVPVFMNVFYCFYEEYVKFTVSHLICLFWFGAHGSDGWQP